MNDREFVEAFEACAIARTDFRHADHVRLAWIYLRGHPLIEAIDRFETSLKRFATHHGVPNLYHTTITWAYILIINERMQREECADWEAFRAKNEDLLRWRPSILDRYYTAETLDSPVARRSFVLPDRSVAG